MSILLTNQKSCNQEINYSKKIRKQKWPRAGGKGLSSSSRKTLISEEMFFNTTNLIRTWQIPSPFPLNKLDVKAWFLGQQFLLFTEATDKANHLIISAHGGYFPNSSIIPVPQNTEIVALGPHGWDLSDPNVDILARNRVLPYAFITRSETLPAENTLESNIKALAGAYTRGYIRNYMLAKFQKFENTHENYNNVARIVAASRSEREYYPGSVDILTVRNRRGMGYSDLKTLLKEF